MSISELLFCTLAPLGAWESTTEGISAIQQRCHTSPTRQELQTVPNPSDFSVNKLPRKLFPTLSNWMAGLGACLAGNGLFSGKNQLPSSSSTSWDVAWEARAGVWWKGVKAPGKLTIINGLRANPGEILPRKSKSCKRSSGRGLTRSRAVLLI